jgi:hypothetical protein
MVVLPRSLMLNGLPGDQKADLNSIRVSREYLGRKEMPLTKREPPPSEPSEVFVCVLERERPPDKCNSLFPRPKRRWVFVQGTMGESGTTQ